MSERVRRPQGTIFRHISGYAAELDPAKAARSIPSIWRAPGEGATAGTSTLREAKETTIVVGDLSHHSRMGSDWGCFLPGNTSSRYCCI